MARTEKNSSDSNGNNKIAYLSIGLTLVLCCVVAIGMICLDMSRSQQLKQMTADIDNLKETVSNLKQQLKHQENLLNNTATTVKQIKKEDNTRKQEESGDYDYDYDEDNYYDEEDEDEDTDAGTEEGTAPPPVLYFPAVNTTETREKRHAIPVREESYLTSSQKFPFIKNLTGSSPLLLYSTLSQKGDKYVGKHSTYRPNNIPTSSYISQRQWSTSQPQYVLQRVSRVMRTPDTPSTSKPLSTINPHEMLGDSSRPLPTINPYVSRYTQYQEQRQPEETVVRPHSRRRSKQRSRHRDVEVFSGESETTDNFIAAHYGGDTTKYRTGHHRHYDRNNDRMYHPDGRFKDWVQSSWVTSTGMTSHFSMQDGRIRISKPGLYLVYAQIYYADHHDINGFRIYQNDNIVVQCTTMTYSLVDNERVMKRNTCFTSVLIYTQASDTISLREVEGERYTVFEPTKSFFGLVRLNSGT